jgi:hypothetical protein
MTCLVWLYSFKKHIQQFRWCIRLKILLFVLCSPHITAHTADKTEFLFFETCKYHKEALTAILFSFHEKRFLCLVWLRFIQQSFYGVSKIYVTLSFTPCLCLVQQVKLHSLKWRCIFFSFMSRGPQWPRVFKIEVQVMYDGICVIMWLYRIYTSIYSKHMNILWYIGTYSAWLWRTKNMAWFQTWIQQSIWP